jgi:signal transduction histidine kinase/ActR/RegA family two-component response regulator
MRRKISLIKYVQFWVVFIIIVIGASIITLDFLRTHRDFRYRADFMRREYTREQKKQIKREVMRVVDMINNQRRRSEELLRDRIKARVYRACRMGQAVYDRYASSRSPEEVKQTILTVLGSHRFAKGQGCFFVSELSGKALLFPNDPQLAGKNLLQAADPHIRELAGKMITIARDSLEGFLDYRWTKPGSEGRDFRKISFVKQFSPFNWLVGTGLYLDEMEQEIRRDLLETVSRIRFGKEGYIFINRFNGDALVSNGHLITGERKLWEVFDDPERMKNIFRMELEAARKPEGDYIHYSHVKLTNPDQKSPKISFIFGIPDLHWLVGAGVYLDDVEVDIAAIEDQLNHHLRLNLLFSVLIVLGIMLFALLLLGRLNHRLRKDFQLFTTFFERATRSDEPVDRDQVEFLELDQLARSANRMQADRKQAEEALHKMEKLKSVGTLAGGIAHDFNNILTGLFGNLEVARQDLPPGHPGRKALVAAEKSMNRAVALTKQLLTFAKGGAPVKESVSLPELVSGVVQFDLSGSNVKPVIKAAPDLYPVDADPGQLQQVFSNLTINARQAMPRGGHLRITLENVELAAGEVPGLEPGSYVRCTVADEGSGIDPEQLNRIFDPYFTTKKEGSGLGLATVYSIVVRHGGGISVSSRPGRGTVFTLHLPAASVPPPTKTESPVEPKKGEEKSGPVKVLVMDDEESIRQIVKTMLERKGYRVETTADGLDAVAAYQRAQEAGDPFRVVIMDLTIPGGVGGKEAVKRILALDPQARVVVSSGYADDQVMAEYAGYGFRAVVPKPFTRKKLLEVLAKILED